MTACWQMVVNNMGLVKQVPIILLLVLNYITIKKCEWYEKDKTHSGVLTDFMPSLSWITLL